MESPLSWLQVLQEQRVRFALSSLFIWVSYVGALASTDTITWGGDNSRTGYQNNHNMDPSIVGSPQFGQIFQTQLPGNYNGAAEQVFSQPLVYTTNTNGIQYVYVATTQNNIYKLDAKTGVIVLSRNLHIPFLTSDLNGCVDINPLVGITATGVIDPDTETWYLTSKTYVDQSSTGAKGRPNGRYYVHAINVNDLSERPNFPVDLEGTVARNNPIRSFNGGIHHQRPALLHTGQYIYAGFASHCVQWNFTGWIMGWDKTTGATVERYATEGSGVANTVPGGGVWMSGGGIASDGAGSMFFGTGNGFASQLNGIPVNGHNPPTSLEEAAVHMTINDDGSLTIVDFFMPWEKVQLDGADRDLGTSPLELLPSQFSCGDVKRIGVITGKSGKTYWIDLDNMGGYQNGPNKLDAVLQVYQNENSVYAGAGVYPLEGGYIYINVIQYPSHVFKFSCDNGTPSFTKVADSPTSNAYILGVGHGTVTSLNDQLGTGLVWVSDVEGFNLRVYNAIPQNGLLTEIAQFNVPGTTKFTRPVFGNGRVYMGTTKGLFYGFGSPVNLPLVCSSPYDFGTANLATPTTPKTVSCQAVVSVSVTAIKLTGNPNFIISSLPQFPLAVAAGSNFTFQATFNASQVGPLSSDVIVNTTNSVAGYSINTPVGLKGNGQSINPLLSISPVTLAFQGVITGQQAGGVNQSVIFLNQGDSLLTITNIKYSLASETGPFLAANGTAAAPQAGPFTFTNLPATIPGNSGQTVNVNFNAPTSGNFAAYLTVVTNGGSQVFDVVGTSGNAPVALLEFQTIDGSSWVPYSADKPFTFGNVTENTSRSLKIRLTNVGGLNAARLSVTVSKPPFGVAGLISANNQVDLAEGTTLATGENATATLYCSAPKSQINVDAYNGTAHWTINVDDPTFGKQVVEFFCNAVSEQYPPLASNGNGIYRYVGCFEDNNPGRQLKVQLYSAVGTATNEMCIAGCSKAGYIFAGTEYNRECWCGPTIPNLEVDNANCNYPCDGNINENCGGNGVPGNSGAYISLFADSTRFNGNTTAPSGPFVNPGTLGYISQGCYTEATQGRALGLGKDISANATVYNCLHACAGYTYAGVEYGQECYCGNALAAGSVPALATDCIMTCNGNSSEYCGAGSRLNLYALGRASSLVSTSSTLVTASSSLITTSSSLVTTSSSLVTVSSTVVTVSSSSVTVSSTLVTVSSSLVTTSSSLVATSSSLVTTSSSLVPASSSLVPASSSLVPASSSLVTTSSSLVTTSSSLVTTSSSLVTVSSSITTSAIASTIGALTTTSARTSTSPSATFSGNSPSAAFVTSTSANVAPFTSTTSSAATPSPTTTWNYVGCVNDTTGRALPLALYGSDTMTVELCQSFCASNNHQLAGVEYGRECWCGDVLANYAAAGNVGCNMPCTGNPAETCGGGGRLNVYNNSAFVRPELTPVVGKYTLQGCYAEPATGGRALPSYMFVNQTSMDAEMCTGGCASMGYSLAGIEFGQECWCSNALAPGTTKVNDAECNFLCPGDSQEYCGAGLRLAVYSSA